MNTAELLLAAARNQVTRHDLALRAHGKRTFHARGLWRCAEAGGGPFLAAVTTAAGIDQAGALACLAELRATRPDPIFVWDCFQELQPGPGWFQHDDELVYARPPGSPPDEADPDGLEIRLLSDAALLPRWQAVEAAAFDGPAADPIYPPATLDDPRCYLLLGRIDGEDVACASAFLDHGVIGVYDVGTVPAARGRGVASALMRRVLRLAPEAPSVLQPSAMARSMYRRLGYKQIGRVRRWASVAPAAPSEGAGR